MRKASWNGSPGRAVVRASSSVRPLSLTARPRTAAGPSSRRPSRLAASRPRWCSAGPVDVDAPPANAAAPKTSARTAAKAASLAGVMPPPPRSRPRRRRRARPRVDDGPPEMRTSLLSRSTSTAATPATAVTSAVRRPCSGRRTCIFFSKKTSELGKGGHGRGQCVCIPPRGYQEMLARLTPYRRTGALSTRHGGAQRRTCAHGPRADHPGAGALLERSAQLEALDERARRGRRAGRGRLVLVGGEAGVGKTALLRRVLRRAAARPDPLGRLRRAVHAAPARPARRHRGGGRRRARGAGRDGATPHEVVAALPRELRGRAADASSCSRTCTGPTRPRSTC